MKEMLKRAARTFIQAALGYVAANLIYIVSSSPESYDYMKNTVMGLLISAVAAGLSAVMNMPHKSKETGQCDSTPADPLPSSEPENYTQEAPLQEPEGNTDDSDGSVGDDPNQKGI